MKEAQRTLGSEFTWVCDAIDNPIKHAMGNAPNSEFVIDGEGVIRYAEGNDNPADQPNFEAIKETLRNL